MPAHQRTIIVVAKDQIRRNHPVAQHVLVVINVVEQEVDRGDPLDDPALDVAPFLGRQDARQDVERQDPVDRLRIGIDRKGNAEIVKLGIGGGGALLECADRQTGEALADDMARRAAQHLAIKALRIVTAEDRAIHLST